MSKKTTLNSNRPVEERLTAFLKNKAELYSRSTAMSEALFPPLQPNDDPAVGAYGQLVTASSSCRIQSKNSARKLAYSSMAEAVMKLALKSVIPEAVNFIVTGGNNSITLETAKGANFFWPTAFLRF